MTVVDLSGVDPSHRPGLAEDNLIPGLAYCKVCCRLPAAGQHDARAGEVQPGSVLRPGSHAPVRTDLRRNPRTDEGALTVADKTIDPQDAADLYAGALNARVGPWLRGTDQLIRHARWQDVFWLVVIDAGTAEPWGLEYRDGSTEDHEGDYPWEDAAEPLPLVRLYPHEVTTIGYRTEAAK